MAVPNRVGKSTISTTSESDSSDTDTEKHAEDSLGPSAPKKSRKFSGAATYKTKFKPVWKKEFPFVTSVQGDPFRLVLVHLHAVLCICAFSE